MKNMLYAVLALIAAVVAGYFLYTFQTTASNSALVIGIASALVAVVFGGLFMFGKVNQHEDIHITE